MTVRTRTVARLASGVIVLALASACGGGGGGGDGGAPRNGYTVGGTVSGLVGNGPVLRNNNGDDLAISGNGAFTFPIPVADGATYAVSVQSQPANAIQNCVVMNLGGRGTVAAGNVNTVSVVCANIGKFGYIANQGSSSVAGFSADAATGALKSIPGSAFAVPAGANAVVVDGSGQHVYVSGAAVTVYGIDSASGGLLKIAGATAPIPDIGGPLTVDPTGRFVYALSFPGYVGPCCPQLPGISSVLAFSFDRASGALTEVSSSLAGYQAVSVTVDPRGKFLYARNAGSIHLRPASGSVSVYTIDSKTGALGAGTTMFQLGENFNGSVAIEPSGRFAYLDGGPQPYAINPATGVLTPIAVNGPAGAEFLTFESSGTFAYGTCNGGICAYRSRQNRTYEALKCPPNSGH